MPHGLPYLHLKTALTCRQVRIQAHHGCTSDRDATAMCEPSLKNVPTEGFGKGFPDLTERDLIQSYTYMTHE